MKKNIIKLVGGLLTMTTFLFGIAIAQARIYEPTDISSIGSITGPINITGSGTCFSADSPTLVVDCSNHRVGIGITTPNNILTIFSNTNTRPNITSNNGAAATEQSYDNSSDAADSWANGRANDGKYQIEYSTGATFGSGVTSQRFTIDTTGNVGVGTTSPYAKLSISSFNNGAQPQLVVASSTGSSATSTDFIVTSNGNVGIGTPNPTGDVTILRNLNTQSDLSVASNYQLYLNTNVDNNLQGSGIAFGVTSGSGVVGASITHIRQGSNSYGDLTFNTRTNGGNVSEKMRLLDNGNLGIGTTTAFAVLSASSTPTNPIAFAWAGRAYAKGQSSATNKNAECRDSVTGELVDSGNTTCITSSIKTKHDISTISSEEALKDILNLKPVSFTYNDGGDRRVGFIAEEVAKVDPRLVEYASEDITFPKSSGTIYKGDPVSVEYANITSILVKAFQELYTTLQNIVARVSGLEDKFDKQQQQIDSLQVQINALK